MTLSPASSGALDRDDDDDDDGGGDDEDNDNHDVITGLLRCR